MEARSSSSYMGTLYSRTAFNSSAASVGHPRLCGHLAGPGIVEWVVRNATASISHDLDADATTVVPAIPTRTGPTRNRRRGPPAAVPGRATGDDLQPFRAGRPRGKTRFTTRQEAEQL
jgi:hypothetical protein